MPKFDEPFETQGYLNNRLRLKTRVILLALVAGLTTACSPTRYRTYYIPSESMMPTLRVNDRILSDQAAYRTATPQRGDVIIFRAPDKLTEMLQGAMQIDAKTVFVKRVIGLPGDMVEVKQGKVYVNHQPLQEPYIASPPDYTWGPVKVPANSFVVLGDNRNNAFDSHFWGVVPRDNIVGKVFWRYWPPERFGAIESAVHP